MYLQTLKLEKDALKDFREEERAIQDYHSKTWWNETLPVRLYDVKDSSNDQVDDEEYEGGRGNEFNDNQQIFEGAAALKSRKKANQNCFQRLIGYGGSDQKNKFDNMTKE